MAVTMLAQEGHMGSNTYYLTTMKANTLITTVGYASEMENWPDMSVDERMQRELKGDRVATEIVPYIINDPEWFFGALIVDIYSGWEHVKFQPLTDVAEIKYAAYEDTMRCAGFLTLPDDKRLIALDGQHRLAALSMAIRGQNGIPGSVKLPDNVRESLVGHPELGNADITVMFIKHENDTKIRKIFNKVNRYAKQTSKGDNIITSEDDMVAIIARRMFNGPDAPLRPIGDQAVVNWKSNTIPLRSKNLTTLSAIYTMSEIILEHYDITPKARKTDDALAKGTAVMKNFWNLSMEKLNVFAQYKEYVINNKPLENIRRKNLLLKPVTHTALAQAVKVALDHGHSYEELIDKLNKIDWSNDNPVWANVLVTNSSNKKMITGSQALKNAGNIIAYMLIGNEYTEKEKEQLLQILRDANSDEGHEVELPEIL